MKLRIRLHEVLALKCWPPELVSRQPHSYSNNLKLFMSLPLPKFSIYCNGQPSCTFAGRVACRPTNRRPNLSGPDLGRWLLRLFSSRFAGSLSPNSASLESLLASGHAGAMLQARKLGKELLVGIHSDEEIMVNKGPTVMTLKERLVSLRAKSRT